MEVTPADLKSVGLLVKVFTYSFVTKQSTLKVRAQLEMSWTDPKLCWNPDEFDSVAGFRSVSTE